MSDTAAESIDSEEVLETAPDSASLAERGASLVEYGLLIALIALVAMAGVQVMGGAVGSAINDGASSVQQAGN